MTNSKQAGDFLDRFSRQLRDLAGPGLESLGVELRQQIQAAASATFDRMDLVPREEFEAHKAVLLRTREKLEQLEKQLAELETRLADGKGTTPT
ncbi:MAG: accessory factor UbiK family protein [Bacteroidales bacterium]|nr:accessory factor UbiK family protein [Bacteroidales bacterium]